MKSSIKAVLSAYYSEQGLTGKHRRAAMRHDMRSLRRQGVRTDQRGLKGRHGDGLTACGASWGDLREGERYWCNRSLAFRAVRARQSS